MDTIGNIPNAPQEQPFTHSVMWTFQCTADLSEAKRSELEKFLLDSLEVEQVVQMSLDPFDIVRVRWRRSFAFAKEKDLFLFVTFSRFSRESVLHVTKMLFNRVRSEVFNRFQLDENNFSLNFGFGEKINNT